LVSLAAGPLLATAGLIGAAFFSADPAQGFPPGTPERFAGTRLVPIRKPL